MKKNVCLFAAVMLLGCLNFADAEEVKSVDYAYNAPIINNAAVNNAGNSVQLYCADTPDANRTKAIRENQEAGVSEASTLPTLSNTSTIHTLQPAQNAVAQYTASDILTKIDKINTQINDMNKNLLSELKKINEKVEVLNAQNANIKEVNKKTAEHLPLSKEIQKAFAESSTRDLKDIPTAIHQD